MKSQLHKSIHILYHDVLPTASGMISGGLCMVVGRVLRPLPAASQ